MENVILQMTKDCPREDCDISTSGNGTANTFSVTCVWNCSACHRGWTVTERIPSPPSYGKDGKAKPQELGEARVTELEPRRMQAPGYYRYLDA